MPETEPDEAVYDGRPGETPEVPDPPQAAEFPPDNAEYGYWDPHTQVVQPLSPQPLSDAPASDGGTSEKTAEQPIEFDQRWLKEFEGLLYIGALTSTFTWLGHRITVRTLKTDEVIESGLLIKDLVGTPGEPKAYQCAVLAGAVLSVDGKELPIPLSSAPGDTQMRNRYEWIMRNWFAPTIDHVYQRYWNTEVKAREVIDAMVKALG